MHFIPQPLLVQILKIILVLRRESTTIQAIPCKQHHHNLHHMWRWIGNLDDRIASVVLGNLLCEQSLQKERQQQEDVAHIHRSNSRWQFLLAAQILEYACHVWGDWD